MFNFTKTKISILIKKLILLIKKIPFTEKMFFFFKNKITAIIDFLERKLVTFLKVIQIKFSILEEKILKIFKKIYSILKSKVNLILLSNQKKGFFFSFLKIIIIDLVKLNRKFIQPFFTKLIKIYNLIWETKLGFYIIKNYDAITTRADNYLNSLKIITKIFYFITFWIVSYNSFMAIQMSKITQDHRYYYTGLIVVPVWNNTTSLLIFFFKGVCYIFWRFIYISVFLLKFIFNIFFFYKTKLILFIIILILIFFIKLLFLNKTKLSLNKSFFSKKNLIRIIDKKTYKNLLTKIKRFFKKK